VDIAVIAPTAADVAYRLKRANESRTADDAGASAPFGGGTDGVSSFRRRQVGIVEVAACPTWSPHRPLLLRPSGVISD